MDVRITSSILHALFSNFGTGAGPDMIPLSFILLEWRDAIHPIYDFSLRSASGSFVQLKGDILLFFQPDDQDSRVHFGVWIRSAVPCLSVTSLSDRFAKVVLDGMLHRSYPGSQGQNYFRTQATVAFSGCITNCLGHQEKFIKLSVQDK